jgi:hypothetical protein
VVAKSSAISALASFASCFANFEYSVAVVICCSPYLPHPAAYASNYAEKGQQLQACRNIF